MSEFSRVPPDERQDGFDARRALREGLEQARAAGPVGVSLTVDSSGTRAALRAAWPDSRLVAVLARVFSAVPAQVELHGVLELARHRARLAGRHVSVLHDGERAWSGRPGRLLTTLEPEPASARTSPLVVLDLLGASDDVTADRRAGAADAPGDVRAEVGGPSGSPPARHLVVTTAGPPGRPTPRVQVWLEGTGRIRTLRYPVDRDTITVTLHGVATDPAPAPWDRLPGPA
ncbi:hypothetical protein [Kineococcus sp. SYSU DK002]|uniref:hypothetical protein n=1 Tax=Kineococcus sp. SYSU DK002 TaxID=3383123 RepID=UPI003D7CBA3A